MQNKVCCIKLMITEPSLGSFVPLWQLHKKNWKLYGPFLFLTNFFSCQPGTLCRKLPFSSFWLFGMDFKNHDGLEKFHHLGTNANLLLTSVQVKVIFPPLETAGSSTNYPNDSSFLQFENYVSCQLNVVFFNVNFLTSYDFYVRVVRY